MDHLSFCSNNMSPSSDINGNTHCDSDSFSLQHKKVSHPIRKDSSIADKKYCQILNIYRIKDDMISSGSINGSVNGSVNG